MNFLIIVFLSSFIVNFIIQWFHLYTFISFTLLWTIILSNKILYEKLTKETVSLNPFINIKNKLVKYNLSPLFLIIWIIFYLWILTICVFVIPWHPVVYWITMTEILPLYTITEPIVRFLLIQTPISGLIWLGLNIIFLYKKYFAKKI